MGKLKTSSGSATLERHIPREPAEQSPSIQTARELAERYKTGVIEPGEDQAYRRAIDGLVALGGADPNAWAPPRRRFR